MIPVQKMMTKDVRWLLSWVVWPIGTYCISWVGSTWFIAIYPLVLTVVQLHVLKERAGAERTAYWFGMPLIYTLAFLMMPRLVEDLSTSFTYLDLVFKYYLCQCAAELLLFCMFTTWRFGWYSVANLMASAVWYVGAKLGVDLKTSAYDWNWLALAIPATAVLANTVTGFGLLKATGK